MAKYNGGYSCDKKAKNILKDIATNNWFSACTTVWDEENEMDEYAPIDEVFTAYTNSGKMGMYAIEIKERKGYNHNDYDEWLIEEHKFNTMKKYKEQGYKPLYFNIYKDGYYYLWDYETIASKSKTVEIPIKPHTQGDDNEKLEMKKRIMINASDCIRSGRTDN